jgi:hypothetical protein
MTTLVFVSLLWSQTIRAATDLREYNVELVVFETTDPEPQNEHLPIEIDLQIPEQAIDFDNAGGLREARQQGFVPLEAKQGSLREVVDRLNRSSRYRIVLYRAWRQPGLPFETAVPVRIHGGTDYTGRFEPPRTAITPPQGMIYAPLAEPVSSKPQQLEEVDGTVTVSLQRYLHVNADLVFREPLTAPMPPPEPPEDAPASEDTPTPEEGPAETAQGWETSETGVLPPGQPALIPGQPYLQPYVLKQRRRMRSREIHYFDNPRFGLITLITPYEPEPEPEAEVESQPQN